MTHSNEELKRLERYAHNEINHALKELNQGHSSVDKGRNLQNAQEKLDEGHLLLAQARLGQIPTEE